jgi:DHA3 family macrolide efflux protein-like MFS transporter
MIYLAITFIFVFGFMNSIANSSFFSVLQTLIPNEIQGRVFTLVMASTITVTPIGLIIASPIAEIMGIRFWFVIAGISILIGSLMGFVLPGLKDLEKEFSNVLNTE